MLWQWGGLVVSVQFAVSVIIVVFIVVVIFAMIGRALVVVGGPERTPGSEGSPGCWTFW